MLLLALLPAACSIDLSEHPSPVPALTVTPPGHETTIHLIGHLVFIQSHADLVQLDLQSGQTSTLFHAPHNAWLAAAAVSPDGKQVVIAYASAPKNPLQQIAYTDLDILSADGSDTPRVLVQRTDPKEEFAFPQWSADGRYIYYAHTIPDTTGLVVQYTYTIERVAYPAGQPQKLIENAIWPRLSPDGKKLAYVSFNPQIVENDLYIADVDGTHAQLVVPAGTFYAVDAPLFSRDSQALIFSAVGGPAASQLSSYQFISARQPNVLKHNIPSDWWRVDLATGKITSLTRMGDIGLYGDFSPDGQHIAFVAASGLYLMNSDGSNLTQLINDGPEGTISWIP
ncbi:MAG TPA: DPP IV N-terminal domain-containing protein [Anaerolineae bacterium]|nr:DPP IV N-terminal domain-containing protein [Anaerolineae bacterium]